MITRHNRQTRKKTTWMYISTKRSGLVTSPVCQCGQILLAPLTRRRTIPAWQLTDNNRPRADLRRNLWHMNAKPTHTINKHNQHHVGIAGCPGCHTEEVQVILDKAALLSSECIGHVKDKPHTLYIHICANSAAEQKQTHKRQSLQLRSVWQVASAKHRSRPIGYW